MSEWQCFRGAMTCFATLIVSILAIVIGAWFEAFGPNATKAALNIGALAMVTGIASFVGVLVFAFAGKTAKTRDLDQLCAGGSVDAYWAKVKRGEAPTEADTWAFRRHYLVLD